MSEIIIEREPYSRQPVKKEVQEYTGGGSWYTIDKTKYNAEDILTFDVMGDIPILHLTSTDDSPFLYKGHNSKFESRFIHETARDGARFTDGNNGDYWRVVKAIPEHERMIVQNLTQGGVKLMYWDRIVKTTT